MVEMTHGAWVYILTNRSNGTLYIGVTTDLARRIWEHRSGTVDGFSKRYGLTRLVYHEHHATLPAAKQRESNHQRWSRAWKVRLILKGNLNWDDLYDRLT
jgi:putative endonuclease